MPIRHHCATSLTPLSVHPHRASSGPMRRRLSVIYRCSLHHVLVSAFVYFSPSFPRGWPLQLQLPGDVISRQRTISLQRRPTVGPRYKARNFSIILPRSCVRAGPSDRHHASRISAVQISPRCSRYLSGVHASSGGGCGYSEQNRIQCFEEGESWTLGITRLNRRTRAGAEASLSMNAAA